MSGRMELLGVFALVLVVWAIVRMLDEDPRRSPRRYEPTGHTFDSSFVPCPMSGAYNVVTEPASSRAASAERMVEAEATSCSDDSGAAAHWWSGEDDSVSSCDDSDSDSSGSWDFGDD